MQVGREERERAVLTSDGDERSVHNVSMVLLTSTWVKLWKSWVEIMGRGNIFKINGNSYLWEVKQLLFMDNIDIC